VTTSQPPEDNSPASAADRTRERVLARSRQRDGGDASAPASKGGGFLHELRGWSDALFFAFLLAMFIRTYVFELFMIPTGSMTPTLIGDEGRFISEIDWDGDGDDDIVALPTPAGYSFDHVYVHLKEADGRFGRELILHRPSAETKAMLERNRGLRSKAERNKSAGRKDMILVNKFAYWFTEPDRGDIIVFKVPDRPEYGNPFDPAKPVYIKRCVALPGEHLHVSPMDEYDARAVGDPDRISPAEHGGVELLVNSVPLKIDGKPVSGAPFDRLHHFPWAAGTMVEYAPQVPPIDRTISDSGVMMFGDNQFSSLDGRAWGEVPLSHLRGKAVLRYWPVRAFGFLDNP